MNCKIKFSIVIPVRNSINTLKYTLMTCLAQTYNNFEIIISDNFSEDNIKEMVDEFNSNKIKYFRTESYLPMTYNYRIALRKVKGDYVIFLGADDGLHSYALELLNEILSNSNEDVITWNLDTYGWPNSPHLNMRDRMILRENYSFRKVNGLDIFKKVINFQEPYMVLPMLYMKSAVKVEFVNKIKQQQIEIFDSMSPDVYSGMLLASMSNEYLQLDFPLSFHGSAGNSIGGTAVKYANEKVVQDFLNINEKYKLYINSYFKEIVCIPIAVEDSANYLLEKNIYKLQECKINYKELLKKIMEHYILKVSSEITFINSIIDKIYRAFNEISIIETEEIINWFERDIVAKYIPELIEKTKKNSNMDTLYVSKSLNFNMKNFDINNIYDAMEFSEKLLDNKKRLVKRAKKIGGVLFKINHVIEEICNSSNKIGICGAGAHGIVLYNEINNELKKRDLKAELYFFDSNDKLVGEKVCDRTVYSYKDINKIKPITLVIASYKFQEEIYQFINNNVNYNVKIIKLYKEDEELYFQILINVINGLVTK